MPSPGFGRNEVKILLFCFNGKWEENDKKLEYTPELKKEVEIDRFLRKEKLIGTDVANQLNKHLSRLVKEGWLHKEDDKYCYIRIELLGLSMLLLFVATYDPDSIEELLVKPAFKESWNYFKDTLFYDIYPFTQKYDLEGTVKSIRTEILEPPIGSENIEDLLNSKERRRTIQETIKKLEHEHKEFRYYLLANPFENREVCDLLSDLSLKHHLEFVENIKGSHKFSDRSIKSRLSRFGWRIGLDRLGLNLKADLNIWKTGTYLYDDWANPILSALESKFFSSKKFAVYVSTLVVSGSLYRYVLHHNEAKVELPISYRAISTELMLTHPINLVPLLGYYLNEKKPKELDAVDRLGRILVRPDPTKSVWQPVYALPYRYNSTLPAGHPGAYPLIALAILIHGSIESDETLYAVSGVIGEEAKNLIEKNSFSGVELPMKAIDYYFSLRDFILKDAHPLIDLELKERVSRLKELEEHFNQAQKSNRTKEIAAIRKNIESELTSQFIMFHFERPDSDDWDSDEG